MALKLIRKTEKDAEGIRSCFVEAKQKKALVTMYSAVAETRVKEDGEDVHLYCEWMDQDPEELYFEATKESIFEFLTFERDDIEELETIREELLDECDGIEGAMASRFRDEYEDLMDAVRELLAEKDVDVSFME